MVLKMTFFNFWRRGTVSEISAKNLLKMRGWVKITPLENFFSKEARWKLSSPHSFESSPQGDSRKVRHSLGQLSSTWVPFSRMVQWNLYTFIHTSGCISMIRISRPLWSIFVGNKVPKPCFGQKSFLLRASRHMFGAPDTSGQWSKWHPADKPTCAGRGRRFKKQTKLLWKLWRL